MIPGKPARLLNSAWVCFCWFGTGLCSYRVRGVAAEHSTVESYTIIISLQSYLYYWYSITHSRFHSRLTGVNPSFSANPPYRSLPFLLQDSLYGFPRLFTVTSEHIRLFIFLVFSPVFTLFLLSVSCGRLS